MSHSLIAVGAVGVRDLFIERNFKSYSVAIYVYNRIIPTKHAASIRSDAKRLGKLFMFSDAWRIGKKHHIIEILKY